jgi:hypothetical protein
MALRGTDPESYITKYTSIQSLNDENTAVGRFFRLSPHHFWRRVDMWLVQKKSVAYAIMQYTGCEATPGSLDRL